MQKAKKNCQQKKSHEQLVGIVELETAKVNSLINNNSYLIYLNVINK